MLIQTSLAASAQLTEYTAPVPSRSHMLKLTSCYFTSPSSYAASWSR